MDSKIKALAYIPSSPCCSLAKVGFFLSFLLEGAVTLAVEKTGGLLALSHNAAVSSGPLAGFPQPATVALAVSEADQKTFWL